VTINGLTLAGGHVGGPFPWGGAIYSTNSSLLLENSSITGNYAASTGGAIFFFASKAGGAYYARLANSSIHANSTPFGGDTVFFETQAGSSTNASIANSTISNNTSGGIYFSGPTYLAISGSQISSNATMVGGAIRSGTATKLVLANSTITGNYASQYGGGLFLYNTPAVITLSVISGNTAATGSGGGVLMSGRTDVTIPLSGISISYSTISGNSAYYYGGGIDLKRAGMAFIRYSLISNNQLTAFNSGGNGGGLAIQYATYGCIMENSTVYHNFAYHSGGGIGIFNANAGSNSQFINVTIAKNGTFNGYSNRILGAGEPQISNSILANNNNAYGQTQDLVGSFLVNYSLIKNASAATIIGANNITSGADPQLGPLTVNGGPTLTMLPAATSPVIDAGENVNLSSDQRGLPRKIGAGVDMGAVERQLPEVMIFRNGFDST